MKNLYLTLLFLVTSTLGFAQCGQLYDGFESGSYSPTWTNNGSMVFTVDNVNPAQGTYSLLSSTSGAHLGGLSSTFTTTTPNEITWFIYPTSTGAECYFVAGDVSMVATNCVVFSYWNGSAIRFFGSTGVNFPAAINQWHEVSMKDIDWVNRNFDIYIDGVLQSTNFPFRSTTMNTMEMIHLYHLTAGTASRWDHILFDGAALSLDVTGTDVSCFGGSDGSIDLTVTNGTMPISYTWNNGSMIEDPSGLTAGSYYVDVLDGNGCTGSDTIYIAEPAQLVIAGVETSPSTCSGMDGSVTTTVNGGTAGYTFDWSTGATTSDLTGVGQGSYMLTVTDQNLCTITDTFYLTDPAPTPASISWTNDTTCSYYGVENLVGGSPAGGVWTGNGVSGSTFDPSSAGLGAHTLVYTYTDGANCVDSAIAVFYVDECLSLVENFKENVNLFPNPTTGELNIVYNGINTDLNLEMFDLSGKLVLSQELKGNAQQLDVSSLKPGVYHVKITSGFASMVEQLIIN